MTLLERDEHMREEGREEEWRNTERERQCADQEQKRAEKYYNELAALKRKLAELEQTQSWPVQTVKEFFRSFSPLILKSTKHINCPDH